MDAFISFIKDYFGNFFIDFTHLILTHATSILAFILALLVISRAFSEKRKPGNFFAWFFFVLSVPLIAGPLYLRFGGRKSKKVADIKRTVKEQAEALSISNSNETSSNQTIGNAVEILPNGESYFERICKEIVAAKHAIHIATYIFGKDEPSNKIADLLSKRAQDGVQVKLLLDSLGCWNTTRRLRHNLRKAGAEVAMFMPVMPLQTHSNANLRNHRKIAIFDHQIALVGGHNIDKRFIGATPDPDRFSDLSVAVLGPAVAELSRTFYADWAFASKQDPASFKSELCFEPEKRGSSEIRVIPSGPDVQNDPLWEQILQMIHGFEKKLTIITPYFIPDEVIFQSLIVKARSGKLIQLILPLHSNHSVTDIARHDYIEKLDQAGVEIRFYTPRMLHAKLIIADDNFALLGSANIDIRSLFLNFEIGLLHTSESDIKALSEWAEEINKESIDYAEAAKKDGFLPGKKSSCFVRLIEPLL